MKLNIQSDQINMHFVQQKKIWCSGCGAAEVPHFPFSRGVREPRFFRPLLSRFQVPFGNHAAEQLKIQARRSKILTAKCASFFRCFQQWGTEAFHMLKLVASQEHLDAFCPSEPQNGVATWSLQRVFLDAQDSARWSKRPLEQLSLLYQLGGNRKDRWTRGLAADTTCCC